MLIRSSTPEALRQNNSLAVLSAMRRQGMMAHTDLCAETGLASATVSAITAVLERDGVIERLEQKPAGGRGRPRVLFQPRRDFGYVAAVRISSDVVQYSLVDYAGRLIDRFEEARVHADGATTAFGQSFLTALARLAERSRLAREQVLAVSISSKGIVDADSARLLWSPVLGGATLDFAGLIRPLWPARVMLANESLLVAQAIAGKREAEGHAPALAALSLGHSIGLGVARRDRHGEWEVTAPNFGHMQHMAGGSLCRCASQGCVEAYAGFYAVLRTAFQVPPQTIPAKFVPITEMEKIAAQARAGNRMAIYAFRQAGLALGAGLARVISLFGPMPVAVTGPGLRFLPLMQDGLTDAFAETHEGRLNGVPPILPMTGEDELVFEGHVSRALAEIDLTLATARAS
ncbi:transcriptional regulator [Xaviernesmea oryzae]|uniref:Transcriptional regulator n=1 Tax=Xaviernesmea oryzae TaxID=464029 RepID=A0A1Q9AVS4_9HYPH|nr:ROK family protein [Xaviernesmea oryzae]OLP59518.1 transcriptional regulator [Xaviernesmea oryzae]SEL58615.1 Sugar kinase of the NBD/HSP70 family, may contain an N-terminal HTH domain [Xaviernesmea oryzae]